VFRVGGLGERGGPYIGWKGCVNCEGAGEKESERVMMGIMEEIIFIWRLIGSKFLYISTTPTSLITRSRSSSLVILARGEGERENQIISFPIFFVERGSEKSDLIWIIFLREGSLIKVMQDSSG
jgi:hypothetical protein